MYSCARADTARLISAQHEIDDGIKSRYNVSRQVSWRALLAEAAASAGFMINLVERAYYFAGRENMLLRKEARDCPRKALFSLEEEIK